MKACELAHIGYTCASAGLKSRCDACKRRVIVVAMDRRQFVVWCRENGHDQHDRRFLVPLDGDRGRVLFGLRGPKIVGGDGDADLVFLPGAGGRRDFWDVITCLREAGFNVDG